MYLQHNDAEMSVLGAALQDPIVVKRCMSLSVDDFLSPAHKAIFQSMQELYTQDKSIDLVTVDDALTRRKALEEIGGSAYLVQLTQYVPTTANTKAYIDIVKDQSNRRKLCKIASELHQSAQDGTISITQSINNARNALRNVSTGRRAKFVTISEVLIKTYESLERRKNGTDVPIQTGITSFDNLFRGFSPGELTVIGARPSVGKSAFAANIAVNAAKKGKRVAIVSLEMSEIQYGERLLSSNAFVDSKKIQHANLDYRDFLLIVDAIKGLSTLSLDYLFDVTTIEQLYEDVQERVDGEGLDLLLIDYMQLLRTTYKADTENNRVAYISRILKEITRIFKIPIISLSQLNRESQKNPNMKPVLSNLRDSGSIEQDADNVILLHRPNTSDGAGVDPRDKEYFNNYAERGLQYLHVGIEKQRQGPVGGGNVVFNPKYMTFEPIDRR